MTYRHYAVAAAAAAIIIIEYPVLSTMLKPGMFTCSGLVLPVDITTGDLQPLLVWLPSAVLILLVSQPVAHTGHASAHLVKSV